MEHKLDWLSIATDGGKQEVIYDCEKSVQDILTELNKSTGTLVMVKLQHIELTLEETVIPTDEERRMVRDGGIKVCEDD